MHSKCTPHFALDNLLVSTNTHTQTQTRLSLLCAYSPSKMTNLLFHGMRRSMIMVL